MNRESVQYSLLDHVKLGRAFEIYTTQVSSAVDSMRGHVSELQGRLSPALDTMQAIVDQAEQFSPQSRKP